MKDKLINECNQFKEHLKLVTAQRSLINNNDKTQLKNGQWT